MTITCQHDPTYRIENEANGGAGCPRCNLKRVMMVQHVGGAVEVDPAWAVGQAEQYRAMSDGLPDGIVEHDDCDAGMWM